MNIQDNFKPGFIKCDIKLILPQQLLNMIKTGFFSTALMLSIFLISCSRGEAGKTKGNAEITFEETSFDYGEIGFGGNGECEFVFRNTGKTPLLLSHVKSTCGCTVPEWPEEPIQEGGQGVIKVSYDTKRAGTFRKTIYVYSNARNGVQQLSISGRVNRYDEETVN